jgi:uncharacterized membrane protein YfcA
MVWWCIVCFAVMFIGITKSGFGSGVGLMIVPMTAIAMGHIPSRGSEAALGLLLPLLIVGDFLAVWQYYHLFFPENESADPHARHLAARRVLLRLMPGTVIGVILGSILLAAIHSRADLMGALIRIEIGCESILLVALHWWRIYRGIQHRLMPEPLRSNLTGSFAAVSSTLAHAAGPIVAMYLAPLGLDRQLFVGTSAAYFFVLNSAKLPGYYYSGQFAHAEISFTAKFLPLVVIGAIFGRWLNKRLSDKIFTRIVYIVTFALGWYILADGIFRLFGRHIA